MQRTRHALSLLALLTLIAAFGTGCNTMEGAGRDIQALGGEIEEEAAQEGNDY